MQEDEVLKIASCDIRIESANMQLTNKSNSSIKIRGSGIIEFSQEKDLRLTILSNDYDIESIDAAHDAIKYGKIINDGSYFYLELVDVENNFWKADKALLGGYKIFDVNGNSFKSKLQYIDSVYCCNDKSYSYYSFYIGMQYKIPVNKYEKFKNGGFSLNHRSFAYNNIKIKIINNGKFYSICIFDKSGSFSYEDALSVLEAISIATGSIVHPFACSFVYKNQKIKRIFSKKDVHLCPSALKLNDEPWNTSLDTFVLSYISTRHAIGTYLYSIWRTVHSSYSAGFFVFSSFICISIEGIIKQYFNEKGMPNDEFITNIKDASVKIKEIKEIKENVRNMILSSIANGRKFKLKTALHYLKELGVISGHEITILNSVRNQLLHADDINKIENIQSVIDKTYVCLEIFYKIVFLIVGYRGKHLCCKNPDNEIDFKNPLIEDEDNSLKIMLHQMLQTRFYLRR